MGKRIEDMDFDLDDFEGEMYESEETKIDENDDLDVGEEDLDFEFEEDESEEDEGEFESEEYVEEEGELEGELTDIEGENSGIIDLEGELGGYTDYPTEDELKDESNEYEDVSEESEGEFEEGIDEYEEVESEDYNNSENEESWFDEEESEGDYEDAYNRIADEEVEDLESVYGFFDKDGNPVDARKRGTVLLDSIDIGSVIVPTRNRTEPRDITVLEENIKNFHQVSPIHVIPYGEGEYILLDGLRRLHAMINLGHDKIMAYVDDTINPHAVRPLRV